MSECGSDWHTSLVGRSLHPGRARGELLCLEEPLSFWGGVDNEGMLVDTHQRHTGTRLARRVVAMPSGRGSSSSTAVLAELIRSGAAPAAILLCERDAILVVGALVANEIYGISLPIVELDAEDLGSLRSGNVADVYARAAPEAATVTVEDR